MCVCVRGGVGGGGHLVNGVFTLAETETYAETRVPTCPVKFPDFLRFFPETF